MTDPAPDLSIIIPAFNEEARLSRGLEKIRAYFDEHPRDLEVLVVDDGSRDATARLTEEWRQRWPVVRLVSNGENRGKGYSVRHGMLESRGRVALFTDADLSSPIEESEKLFAAMRDAGADVAIGSRAINRKLIFVRQSRMRELAAARVRFGYRSLTGNANSARGILL